MRSRKVVVLIYVSGTREERAEQFEWCNALCERRRYHTYGVAHDNGDGSGWVDAQVLKRSGIVEKIIVYSSDIVPELQVESATGEIPGVAGARDLRPARYRRIRRIKRSGDAGA